MALDENGGFGKSGYLEGNQIVRADRDLPPVSVRDMVVAYKDVQEEGKKPADMEAVPVSASAKGALDALRAVPGHLIHALCHAALVAPADDAAPKKPVDGGTQKPAAKGAAGRSERL